MVDPQSFAQKQCQQVASGWSLCLTGGHPEARLCSRGRGRWCPWPIPSPLSPPPLRKQSRWNPWVLSGRPTGGDPGLSRTPESKRGS